MKATSPTISRTSSEAKNNPRPSRTAHIHRHISSASPKARLTTRKWCGARRIIQCDYSHVYPPPPCHLLQLSSNDSTSEESTKLLITLQAIFLLLSSLVSLPPYSLAVDRAEDLASQSLSMTSMRADGTFDSNALDGRH